VVGTVLQVAEERLANMRTVRAFVQEHNESLVYNTRIDSVLQLSYKEALARGFFWAMVICLYFLQCILHETKSDVIYSTIGFLTFFLLRPGRIAPYLFW